MNYEGRELSRIGEKTNLGLAYAEIFHPEDRQGEVEATYKMGVQSDELDRLWGMKNEDLMR